MTDCRRVDRRGFVRWTALGAVAAPVVGATTGTSAQEPETKIPRRTLGRTELVVSEISFGSYGFDNSDLLVSAVEAGMNLIDTSPRYQEGTAERAVGAAIRDRRSDVILMTKWYLDPGTTKSQLLASLKASLERLQTDHVEIVHVGEADQPEQVKNPVVFEAFAEAKAAGKVKFLGVSTHSGTRREVCEQAIRDGHYDMLCLKHNFAEAEVTNEILEMAHEKNLGIVAFKVRAGAKPQDVAHFAPGKSFELAAAKWALENQAVHSVCVGITSYEDIKLYANARTFRLDDEERRALKELGHRLASTYCRYCGTCQRACPNGVAIADIMRYRMYAESYGRTADARRLYRALPVARSASGCFGCPGFCGGVCPRGLDTREGLLGAHSMLA